jgi:hypothetical protein
MSAMPRSGTRRWSVCWCSSSPNSNTSRFGAGKKPARFYSATAPATGRVETGQILLGLWLVLSPYIFGYFNAGGLRFWHSTLGGLVILLAVLELWQDWERSDKEMLKQGRLFGR